MTPDQELQRAREAQRMTEDPMFKEAREAIYARLRAARISAAPSDIATHTQLIQAEQIADQFFSFFDFALQTGKMAQAHIDELANAARDWASAWQPMGFGVAAPCRPQHSI